MSSGLDLDGTVAVTPWRDPVVDTRGYAPGSRYVEEYWLPVVGPSTLLLLRRLAVLLEVEPAPVTVEPAELAAELGLGMRKGRNGPFARSVGRLCRFGLARLVTPSELEVRTRVPPLPRRHVQRLPGRLREAHEELVAGVLRADRERRRERARLLALSLLELGERPAEAVRQLQDWRYEPALAHEAARWAAEHHHVAGGPDAA